MAELSLYEARILKKLADHNMLKRFNVFSRGKKIERKAYLTFDDGPNDFYTAKIVDLLLKYRAEATFFFNGEPIDSQVELCKDIISEGFIIGNHSNSHIRSYKVKTELFIKDVLSVKNRLAQISKNADSNLYRPPYGLLNSKEFLFLYKNGYKNIFWSVNSLDYRIKNSTEIVNNVIRNLHNGAIILFHDNNQYTLSALEVLIPMMQDKGFTFSTCDKLGF